MWNLRQGTAVRKQHLHAHNVSRRRWNVNLRPVKAKTATGNKKIRVCTSCIRSGKVVKAVKNSVAKAAAKA